MFIYFFYISSPFLSHPRQTLCNTPGQKPASYFDKSSSVNPTRDLPGFGHLHRWFSQDVEIPQETGTKLGLWFKNDSQIASKNPLPLTISE